MATTTLWPTGTTGRPYGSFVGKTATSGSGIEGFLTILGAGASILLAVGLRLFP